MIDKGKWKILVILFVFLAMIGSFVVIINFDPLTSPLMSLAKCNPIQSNPNGELRIMN